MAFQNLDHDVLLMTKELSTLRGHVHITPNDFNERSHMTPHDRCTLPGIPNHHLCQFTTQDKSQFLSHLRDEHRLVRVPEDQSRLRLYHLPKAVYDQPVHPICQISEISWRDLEQRARIGLDWPHGFWCGYCNAVVCIDNSLKDRRAKRKRYEHLADQHIEPLRRSALDTVNNYSAEGYWTDGYALRDVLIAMKDATMQWVIFGEGTTKHKYCSEKPLWGTRLGLLDSDLT